MTSPVTRQEMGRRLIDIVGMQTYMLNDKVEEEALRLIRDGADLTIVYDITGSALCMAAFMGHTRIAREIVLAGANINAADDMFGMTPLMCAAHTGQTDVVLMLIDADAHPLLMDNGRNTALMLAEKCRHKNDTIIAALKDAEENYRMMHHGYLKKEFSDMIDSGLPTKTPTKTQKLQRKGGYKP